MTRTISLIIGIAVVALVAVPAAVAKPPRLDGGHAVHSSTRTSERPTRASQPVIVSENTPEYRVGREPRAPRCSATHAKYGLGRARSTVSLGRVRRAFARRRSRRAAERPAKLNRMYGLLRAHRTPPTSASSRDLPSRPHRQLRSRGRVAADRHRLRYRDRSGHRPRALAQGDAAPHAGSLIRVIRDPVRRDRPARGGRGRAG